MKKILLLLSLISFLSQAQETKNVLFLGNSYTYYNNLPKLIEDIATSQGDVFTHDENTPGGKALSDHAADATSLSKIKQGGWDYVVLQDQSQKPAFNPSFVATNCLPYAKALSDSIYKYNDCGLPVFFMTWGRKNGDASNCANYPPICTYKGMQERLRSSYLIMGQQNNAPVSPVGAVWRDFIKNNPNVQLYNADESHPSLTGSYLAACTFYAAIFQKSPIGVWKPNNIGASLASLIQTQAHQTVFDSLNVWGIDSLVVPNRTSFKNTNNSVWDYSFYGLDSLCLDSVVWDFGNGNQKTGFSVSETFVSTGKYQITSEHWKDSKSKKDTLEIEIINQSVFELNHPKLKVYPNPAKAITAIEVSGNFKEALNLEIVDALGKIVFQKTAKPYKVSENKFQLLFDAYNLKSGIYHVNVFDDSFILSSVLVIP